MIASRGFAAMLAAIVLGSSATQAAEPTAADIEHRADIDSAQALTAQGQFVLAYPVLARIAAAADYRQLSPRIRYEIDTALAYDALQAGKGDEAHRAAMRAAESPLAKPEDWVTRLQLARGTGDFADAYATFQVLKNKAPVFAGTLTDFDISKLERGFGSLPNAATAQFEFEQYLHDLPWRPTDPIFSPDVISYHYAQHLIARLEGRRAFAAASDITTPDVLAVLRADRRFDNLANPASAAKDVDAAARRRIQLMRQKLQDAPESIEIGTELAGNLEQVGRFDEALVQIDKTIADAEAMPASERDYDYDSQYKRALAVKTYFLFAVGRHDEALGVAAAVNGCACTHVWDSALLRGKLLVALGRGSEALTVLEPVRENELASQDRAALRAFRVCAAVQAHNHAGDESLAELQADRGPEPVALIRGLVCRNQLDDAAKLVAADLGDVNKRALILEELQRYKPEKTVTDAEVEIARRWDTVRTRPDVQQAVARVGRINTYDIVKMGDLY